MSNKTNIGIVTFSFTRPETARSNQRLAGITDTKALELGAPVFTQRHINTNKNIDVERIYEPGNPPPTLRIARNAVKWAKRRGVNCFLVVAAKPHLGRCLRDLKKAIEEVGGNIEVKACPEIVITEAREWFCPESTKLRSRSPKAWYPREMILRMIPFSIYKRIAS